MSNLNKAIQHNITQYDENTGTFEPIPVPETKSNHEPYLDIDHNAHPDSIETYESMQNDPQTTHQEVFTTGQEGVMPKSIYKHSPSGKKYLVKPYHYSDPSVTGVGEGWSEMTNRAMFNAGNIPHLIQKTHVTMGQDVDGTPMPYLVVHMDENVQPATNIGKLRLSDAEKHHLYPDKMKIAAMDFLTNNMDRHGDNLLFKISPHTGAVLHPLAIDNSAFQYGTSKNFDMGIQHGAGAFTVTGLKGDMLDYTHAGEFSDWWRKHGPMIKLAFEQQVPHIKDSQLRDHVANSFMSRYAHLDKKVNDYIRNGKWEYK